MNDIERIRQTVTALLDHDVTYSDATQAFERLYILEMLARHKGNRLQAAAAMGVHRNTLRRRAGLLAIPSKAGRR